MSHLLVVITVAVNPSGTLRTTDSNAPQKSTNRFVVFDSRLFTCTVFFCTTSADRTASRGHPSSAEHDVRTGFGAGRLHRPPDPLEERGAALRAHALVESHGPDGGGQRARRGRHLPAEPAQGVGASAAAGRAARARPGLAAGREDRRGGLQQRLRGPAGHREPDGDPCVPAGGRH